MSSRKFALALLAVMGLTAFQMPEAQGPAEDRVGLPDIAGLARIRTTAIERRRPADVSSVSRRPLSHAPTPCSAVNSSSLP